MGRSRAQESAVEPRDDVIRVAVLTGALRGVARIPLEHPFDTVKTKWQANPSFPNAWSAFRSIYRSGGVAEFYTGAIPSALRAMLKEGYRFPLIVALPRCYGKLFDKAEETSMSVFHRSSLQAQKRTPYHRDPYIKLISGASIATIEAVTGCPFERLKVLLMTRPNNVARSAVVRHVMLPRYRCSAIDAATSPLFEGAMCRTDVLPVYLFRGFWPFFLRQLLSWGTFLGVDAKAKEIARRVTGNDTISSLSLVGIAATVAIANTLTVMPFDVIKTEAQRLTSVETPKKTSLQIAANIYARRGVRGFFVGFSVRLVQYGVSAMLSVPALEYLEARSMALDESRHTT